MSKTKKQKEMRLCPFSLQKQSSSIIPKSSCIQNAQFAQKSWRRQARATCLPRFRKIVRAPKLLDPTGALYRERGLLHGTMGSLGTRQGRQAFLSLHPQAHLPDRS
ncbi:hypothetical protein [Sedimentimonas flavescens]|uniref:hypothetical protein n=1 Tax=Sedimentimonas flavescens TaxID=2851012 RepID=UPI0021A2D079|nr:hypothetical protein [Sedimentimonas flavescens]MCT2538319.1 hypothetical protein [Sedimentimonas flavescens]